MKSVSRKDFCRALERRGWHCARVHGSHHIFTRSGRPERITVPVHGNHSLKRGLQAALMKIAGLTESDL